MANDLKQKLLRVNRMPAPQRLQTRDEAQLERLFDLLPDDYYDIVKLLPHSKCAFH